MISQTSLPHRPGNLHASSRTPDLLTLSNRDVPEPDRLSYLHDFVARSVAGLQFTPEDKAGFEYDLSCRRLDGDTVVGSARYSTVRGERTRELTADGRQNYMLTIHDADYRVTPAHSAEFSVSRGDIVIVEESFRQSFDLPATRLRAIVLDHRKMAQIAPVIRTRPIHHVSAQAPGATLLSGYADLLLADQRIDASAAQLAACQLHQLAALALEGTHGSNRPDLAGVAGARLSLIRHDVLHHLTDPELDIVSVARRQGVTPRYIQRLFEREGLTFGQFLRDSRLDLARHAIETGDGRTISAIAYDCGFGDLSHFNRVFRQRFAATPRDIKAAALRKLQ